jgi:hypothetical protein
MFHLKRGLRMPGSSTPRVWVQESYLHESYQGEIT